MLYGKYKNVRNSAWQSLIDFNVHKLPVSVNDIAGQLGVKVIKNSKIHKLKNKQRGLTIYDTQNWYIVFDDTEPVPVCRFTVAHELGHILLGHMMTQAVKYRTFAFRDETEQSADMFAIRLLAPACVLWGLNLHTAEDIARVCNISYTAAKYRAERMQLLYARNKFLTSPLEIKVYEQFKEFVQNIKN